MHYLIILLICKKFYIELGEKDVIFYNNFQEIVIINILN